MALRLVFLLIVERIIVFQAEKVDGHRQQRIQIVYNYIGALDIPSKTEKRHSRKSIQLCRIFQRDKIPKSHLLCRASFCLPLYPQWTCIYTIS